MKKIFNFLKRSERKKGEKEYKQIKVNAVSMVVVAVIVFAVYAFCWGELLKGNPFRTYSYAGIIVAFLMLAQDIVPIEHAEAIKFLGFVSRKFYFGSGLRFKIPFLMEVERRDVKVHQFNSGLLKVISSDNIPVFVDLQGLWNISQINLFLKFEETYSEHEARPGSKKTQEKDKEKVYRILMGKAKEAIRDFAKDHTSGECLREVGAIQDKIKRFMQEELRKWGIGVSDIEVMEVLPSAKIVDELSNVESRRLRMQRIVEDSKELKAQCPDLSDKEITETIMAAHQLADMKIDVKRIDIGEGTLGIALGLLKKFKGGKNG